MTPSATSPAVSTTWAGTELPHREVRHGIRWAPPWSSGVSYYVALLVQLAAVVIVGRWTRTLSLARRRPSRPEQVGAGVALFASGVTWWLVRLVAQGHGIQGSAWRRVRRGIPLPHDHVYLAASGAAIVGVLCALALLLTFMRTAPIGSQRPD